jgi:hypothetical protein
MRTSYSGTPMAEVLRLPWWTVELVSTDRLARLRVGPEAKLHLAHIHYRISRGCPRRSETPPSALDCGRLPWPHMGLHLPRGPTFTRPTIANHQQE